MLKENWVLLFKVYYLVSHRFVYYNEVMIVYLLSIIIAPLIFPVYLNVGTEESLFNIPWFKVSICEWSQIKNLSVKFLQCKVFVRLVFKSFVPLWKLTWGFYYTVNVIITKCSILQTLYLSPSSSINICLEISFIITSKKYQILMFSCLQHKHFFWNHCKTFNSVNHSKNSHYMFRLHLK